LLLRRTKEENITPSPQLTHKASVRLGWEAEKHTNDNRAVKLILSPVSEPESEVV